MQLQRMPESRAGAVRAALARHPAADPGVRYPDWYLRRWHFLPEGYGSERSVRLYDAVVRPVYWAGSEGRVVRLLARWLEQTGARRVLEVGTGPGRLLAALVARLSGVAFSGVELSPFFVAAARRRAAGATIVHGDGLEVAPEGEPFDAVIAAHVAGHLPPPERGRAMAAMAAAVRPGGSLITIEHRWHRIPAPAALRRAAVRGAGFSRIEFFRRTAGEGAQP